MCGIVGQVSLRPGRTGDIEGVRGMRESVAHRGPEGAGEYFSPSGVAALGHRRLSIIDLVTGGQPIYNEDETVAVVLNGEIYNFQSLRAQLLSAGHRFVTSSDTEVIAHLYEEHGVDCLRYLHGMFALLIWDERRRRLVAARDRLRQKTPFHFPHRGPPSLPPPMPRLFN